MPATRQAELRALSPRAGHCRGNRAFEGSLQLQEDAQPVLNVGEHPFADGAGEAANPVPGDASNMIAQDDTWGRKAALGRLNLHMHPGKMDLHLFGDGNNDHLPGLALVVLIRGYDEAGSIPGLLVTGRRIQVDPPYLAAQQGGP